MVDDLSNAIAPIAMTVPLKVLADVAEHHTRQRKPHAKADLEFHTRTPKVKTKYYDRYRGD